MFFFLLYNKILKKMVLKKIIDTFKEDEKNKKKKMQDTFDKSQCMTKFITYYGTLLADEYKIYAIYSTVNFCFFYLVF